MADSITMNRLHTIAPDWMPSEIDGNQVLAWRLMTTVDYATQRAIPCGYIIITVGSELEARLDGLIVRATVLNMT